MENIDNNLIVGLDIGTTKIATVIGYRNEKSGKISVIGHGVAASSGVEFGEIQNINRTVDGIVQSKSIAEQHANMQIQDAYVGIAGHHIKTNLYKHIIYRYGNNDIPISDEEIDNLKAEVFKAAVPPGEQIVDVIPQRYIIDDSRETNSPAGELGNSIMGIYQLITGRQKEVDKIRLCGNNSGTNFKDIVLEPMASGIACLSEDEKKNGVALVDIGGGTTDLIIYIDGSPVYTKVIALGGNVITSDIAKLCQISFEMAEQIKIKYGTCIVNKSNENNLITIPRPEQEAIQISEPYLSKIINCRVQEEILNTIKKEIEYSGYKNKILNIVLTGGGANLRHIKELSKFVLQKPTRIGFPVNGFSEDIPTELKQPMYATALGLLKYGILAEEHLRVNTEDEGVDTTGETKSRNLFGGKKKEKGSDPKRPKEPSGGGWGFLEKVHSWLTNALEDLH